MASPAVPPLCMSLIGQLQQEGEGEALFLCPFASPLTGAARVCLSAKTSTDISWEEWEGMEGEKEGGVGMGQGWMSRTGIKNG